MRSSETRTSPALEPLSNATEQSALTVRRRNQVAWVADILDPIDPMPARCLTTEDLVVELADLATIARLIGELLIERRTRFADWTPVDAQLRQAHALAVDLNRSLNHACAAFAFATLPAPA